LGGRRCWFCRGCCDHLVAKFAEIRPLHAAFAIIPKVVPDKLGSELVATNHNTFFGVATVAKVHVFARWLTSVKHTVGWEKLGLPDISVSRTSASLKPWITRSAFSVEGVLVGYVKVATVAPFGIVAVVNFEVIVDPLDSSVCIEQVGTNPCSFGVGLARLVVAELDQDFVEIIGVWRRKMRDNLGNLGIIICDFVAGLFGCHKAETRLRVVLVAARDACFLVQRHIRPTSRVADTRILGSGGSWRFCRGCGWDPSC